MAQIAILIGVQVGLAVAGAVISPKPPKQQPIDRGKLDDLRFTIVEEGAFIPRVYGKWVRLGGGLFWGTPTFEHVNSTPGRSGGKKGRGAEPPTNNFSYNKSWGAYVCEGPIRSFRRIKEGEVTIFNLATPYSSYYEAEQSGNTLAGGASILTDTTLLSQRKVRLPPGGSVTFANVRSTLDALATVGIYYQSNQDTDITLRVNNTTDYPATLTDTDNELGDMDVEELVLNTGSNTLKITNNHATLSCDIDRIFVFAGLVDDVTGIVDVENTYPVDLNNPGGYYSRPIRVNPTGVATGTTVAGGQANFEIYLGTGDQTQSPTIVTAEGAANTPAHRNVAHIVAKDYQIRKGLLENLTFEIEPLLDDLADVLIAEHKLRGATDAQLNFEALRGTSLEGLYIDRLAPLNETLEALKFFFNFDIVPVDGKITAVPRGGSSVRTIPNHELLAHQEGEERPAGITIEHIEASDLPGGLYIAWISPHESKDFHSGDLFVPLGAATSLETESINLPLVVSDSAEIVAAGKQWLHRKHLQAHPHSFSLSPKHRDLIPTDIITLELPQKTIDVGLVSTQAAMPGIVKAKALPEKSGLYNQTALASIGTGTEASPVKYPANSFLFFADVPPPRDSDTGLHYLVGLCGRGAGTWEGGYLFEETVPDTDEYHRLAVFPSPATTGVLVDDLPGVTNLEDLDEVNEIVLDLYFDEDLFESRPEADIRARDVNILIIGSGPLAEILKFTTATYSAGASPFVRRVTLSGLLRGLKGTENGANAGSSAGTAAALLTDAVQAVPDQFATLRLEREFAAVSVNQALINAPTVDLTNTGNSLRARRMSNAFITREETGDIRISATPFAGPGTGRTFACEFWAGEDRDDPENDRKITLPMTSGTTQAAFMASTTGSWDEESQTMAQTSHAYKNNVASFSGVGAGCVGTTVQALEDLAQRFDFEMTLQYDAPGLALTDDSFLANFGVGLHLRENAEGPYTIPLAADLPISIEWTIPTDYYDDYPEGTVRETIRSYSDVLLVREGIDPGRNPFTIADGEVFDYLTDARPGPRYSFLIHGNELAVYRDYNPAGGNRHLVKIALGNADLFPLRLTTWMPSTDIYLRNVMFGGAIDPSTIFSVRDQKSVFAGIVQETFYYRLFENSAHPDIGQGYPLDGVADFT